MKIWSRFSTAITVLTGLMLMLSVLPLPLFDTNSATLILPSGSAQEDTARALASVLGNPTATLDTPSVHRILFKDGTSVDWLPQEPSTFRPMYKIVALKTIVLGLFSSTTPAEEAEKIQDALIARGYNVQIVKQPDPAFPTGAIVLVLADTFKLGPDYGSAILIRKHAFRIGGKKPKIGSPF